MSYEKREYPVTPGKATLFYKDPSQKKNPNQPDWDGDLVLTRSYTEGETLKLSIWKSMAKNGKEYFTVKENTYYKDKALADNADREVPTQYKASASSFKPKPSYDPEDDNSIPF
jgi:hypothetical protein